MNTPNTPAPGSISTLSLTSVAFNSGDELLIRIVKSSELYSSTGSSLYPSFSKTSIVIVSSDSSVAFSGIEWVSGLAITCFTSGSLTSIVIIPTSVPPSESITVYWIWIVTSVRLLGVYLKLTSSTSVISVNKPSVKLMMLFWSILRLMFSSSSSVSFTNGDTVIVSPKLTISSSSLATGSSFSRSTFTTMPKPVSCTPSDTVKEI